MRRLGGGREGEPGWQSGNGVKNMVVRQYSFDVLKNYPSHRRFTIRKPMEKSIFDTIAQMIGGRK